MSKHLYLSYVASVIVVILAALHYQNLSDFMNMWSEMTDRLFIHVLICNVCAVLLLVALSYVSLFMIDDRSWISFLGSFSVLPLPLR